MIERTRINGGAWQETAYLHTPDGVGELLAQSVNGETKHLYQDGQGSTRFMTDNAQKFELTYTYDAFGNEITELGKTHLNETSIQYG